VGVDFGVVGVQIASGFAVGAIVGMTGVGGGSLMTPMLIGWMGVPPAVAVGTDLIFAAITKGFGSVAHWRHGHVEWRILQRMILSSSLAAIATLACIAKLGNPVALVQWIRPALGVALLLTALAVLFRHKLHAVAQVSPPFKSDAAQRTATFVLGSLIGVLVALSSVGAGAIGATALMLIYPLLATRIVVGTDIAYAVPLTLIAGLGHVLLGHFDGGLLVALLVGSLPGIWLGARLSTQLPEKVLRMMLCAALTAAGVRVMS
jgi:hypothetical protein